MNKAILIVLAVAPMLPNAFAVDGVVLINQSTVMAAGGFPYRIMQAGSYKLSGNLTVDQNTTAIVIAHDNVSLDLNGFTIGGPNTCGYGVFQYPHFHARFRGRETASTLDLHLDLHATSP